MKKSRPYQWIILAVFCGYVLIFVFAATSLSHSQTVTEDQAPYSAEPPSEPEPPASESESEPNTNAQVLSVENILQNPELPNGCEATALTIVLNYLGYAADKMEVVDKYLPKEDFQMDQWSLIGPDPKDAYPGTPTADGTGFYCYPPVIVAAASQYLSDQGSYYQAWDISGADEPALESLLQAGVPVIVWKTRDNRPPRRHTEFVWRIPPEDRLYHPFVNLHTLVLIGYDEDEFFFCDPLGEMTSMSRERFLYNYEQTGMYAVAIQ